MIGVFGAGGFIGRAFLELARGKNIQLRAFDRRPVEGMETETVIMDMADPGTYAKHLKGLDVLVLLVSASVPGTFARDMPSEIERNVAPYGRLIRALSDTDVRRVVFLSSGGAVYGPPERTPVPENHPLRPSSPYGAGKAMIETALRAAAGYAPWDYTILRPSNPIGRGQAPGRGQGLVAEAAHAGLSGRPLPVWGDGSAIRNYFDVRDLAEAILLACKHETARNETFNVGGEDGLSVLQVLQDVERILGRKIPVEWRQARSVDVPRITLDCSRIRQKLGWRRRYSSLEAMEEVVRFQQEQQQTRD